MSGALSERTQDHFRRKVILAENIFNTISRRAEPNFFHMVLLHKTEGMRSRVCIARGETRNGHISNTFYVRNSLAGLFCSKAGYEGDIYKFPSRILFDLSCKEGSEDIHAPLLVSLLVLLSPRETFASDNLCLQPTVKNLMDRGQR